MNGLQQQQQQQQQQKLYDQIAQYSGFLKLFENFQKLNNSSNFLNNGVLSQALNLSQQATKDSKDSSVDSSSATTQLPFNLSTLKNAAI
jgi:hypothetical protein